MSHRLHPVPAVVQRGALRGRQAVHPRMMAHMVSAVGHHHGVMRVSGDEHRLRVQRTTKVIHLRGGGVGGGGVVGGAVDVGGRQVLHACNTNIHMHIQ